jgi:hypothetical protein
MQRYRNLSGDSGVHSFEIGGDYILVQFSGTSQVYKYSYLKAGRIHVEQMKSLALKGKGLNTYINRNTKSLYDSLE